MFDGVVDIGGFEGQFDGVHDNLSPPEDAKGDGEEEAEEAITPEGFEAEAEAVDDDVASEEGGVAVVSGEPDDPCPEGLSGDDGGVDGDDPREAVTEEAEEVDVGHMERG